MKPDVRGLHHDHIDGSAAMLAILPDLYEAAGKPLPFAASAEVAAMFHDPHVNMAEKFGTVTGVLQTADALRYAGYAYGRHRASEGFEYVEAKFAPQCHTAGGLSVAEASRALCAGLRRAQSAFGIRIVPHLCIMRDFPADAALEVARAALSFDGEAVLDLAGTEAGNPPLRFLDAYRLCWGTATRTDCHAAEWVERRPDDTRESYRARMHANLRDAVYGLRADGVSHAITLCDDPDLMRKLADDGVRVAFCPLSNLTLGGIADVRDLRIDLALDAGVICTLNADDDLFLPEMAEVVAVCDAAYGFSAAQAAALAKNVFRGAFGK